ncbi:MAG TPA: transcriptional regulator, partial [Allocoleopsis sp.]
MAYKISSDCLACDTCRPICPEGAISVVDGQYWINPALCDNCRNYDEPQCVVTCPLSLPTPAQAKRGRAKLELQHSTSPDLFINGKNHPF